MRKLFVLFLFLSLTTFAQTESEDRKAITAVLKMQQDAWNKGDMEGFMQGYIKSDSLKFYGNSGLTKGWQNTLENYKKGYPTKAETGNLSFTIDALTKIEEGAYYMMGQFHLVRDAGNANGVFLIIFRKIEGEWKVIADLSC